jgi:hypothetical protein
MSQKDVCDWLAANPGWHPTAEIVAALGQGYKSVQTSLANGAMWRDIEHRRSQSKLGKEWRGHA